jgi:hypothetical protein
VAGRYRALLIGNSTYTADEHNLPMLIGPVKDIAALNRALIDPSTGLFADADVTLLPEVTSSRAVRALGRFFGTATRDDVLLVYFSGHGKLDQSGRLHLCMQDTDSTDLLSTAVSSVRINEFADASRARNVVIVLDCCYAGAFRGADLGQAVAGPGRYVLTSCRGTQLANDASVENGTSFFTQHLVEGLVYAASDQDEDGYVTFSDLYAYVDRRLREAGKQIPQRRVNGDGDLPLAKRPSPAPAGVDLAVQPPAGHMEANRPGPAQTPPGSTAARPSATGEEHAGPAGPRTGGAKRGAALAAAALVVVAGAISAVLLLTGGSSGSRGGGTNATTNPANNVNTATGPGTYVANAPWRLKIDDRISGNDKGCTVTLTDAHSGSPVPLPSALYGANMLQIHQTGSFRWQVNNQGCVVVAEPGSGMDSLPLRWQAYEGDSDAFAMPSRLAVKVTDGNQGCDITLNDPASGQAIDFKSATPGQDNNTVVLNANGHRLAYLSDLKCAVLASSTP